MNVITLKSIQYYLASDLVETDKDYFKCCKGKIRSIIEWKKIPNADYLFAYKKDNQWIISKPDYKKASLLLTKSFCEANLPSMKPQVEPEVEEVSVQEAEPVQEQEVKDAPPILELADEEKFKDENGKPFEIEVRGERKHNKIFFKVKDVAIAFEMFRLNETLTNKRRSSFQEKEHYEKFLIGNLQIIFLTYRGFQRLIEVNRSSISSFTKYVAQKWLNVLFDKTTLSGYILCFDKEHKSQGLVYLITSPIILGIKVGFWHGSIEELKCSYRTYFGEKITLYTFHTNDAPKAEKSFMLKFKKYRISNEIFEKDILVEYIKFFQHYE